MGSNSNKQKPHAVCVTFPAQGHFTPMLNLAKLLHQNGFHITFVNTDYNCLRIRRACGPASLDGLQDFRFASISDGLPMSDDVTRNVFTVCPSIASTCLDPFCELITKLNSSGPEVPPVSCIVADGIMSFTVEAAERFGLPEVLLWTTSACGLLAYTQYKSLVEKGYVPMKDMSQVTNGYMETIIDWVPGMKNFRLKDFPSFIRPTGQNDIMFNFLMKEVDNIPRAKALIINTFDTLEPDALNALSAMFSRVYTVGPLRLMSNDARGGTSDAIQFSLWKEESHCIKWLNSKEPGSVLYVNFGSVTVVSVEQMTEFAWGLANSKKPFLWIIRPNLVTGAFAMLSPEFTMETKDRSLLVSWCNQEQVLKHPAVGGFLTHSGWNSTLESITSGVPLICWPFFAEQQTNCRFSCVEWGIGMEIDDDVKRDEVEALVRELMDGEKGAEMRLKALEWKRKAEETVAPGGSSYLNLDTIIKEVLLQ